MAKGEFTTQHDIVLAEADQALGRYMRNWGHVEQQMWSLCAFLLNTNPVATFVILVALGEVYKHVDVAREMGQHLLIDSDVAKLLPLLKRVTTANRARNRIVHGYWQMSIQAGSVPDREPGETDFIRAYSPQRIAEGKALMSGKKTARDMYRMPSDKLDLEGETARLIAVDLEAFIRSARLKSVVPETLEEL